MVLRVSLAPDALARVDRLRREVAPIATRRTRLVAELVRVGLEEVERNPARLVRPALPPVKESR